MLYDSKVFSATLNSDDSKASGYEEGERPGRWAVSELTVEQAQPACWFKQVEYPGYAGTDKDLMAHELHEHKNRRFHASSVDDIVRALW